MGAGENRQAEHYFRKLTQITVLFAVVWNVLIFGLTPVLMHFYALEPQTKSLGIRLVLLTTFSMPWRFPSPTPWAKACGQPGMWSSPLLFPCLQPLGYGWSCP